MPKTNGFVKDKRIANIFCPQFLIACPTFQHWETNPEIVDEINANEHGDAGSFVLVGNS